MTDSCNSTHVPVNPSWPKARRTSADSRFHAKETEQVFVTQQELTVTSTHPKTHFPGFQDQLDYKGLQDWMWSTGNDLCHLHVIFLESGDVG